MLSHVSWSFLLLGSEERENMLNRVDWLVLLLAREEAKREKVLCHVDWLVLLLASREARRGGEKWLVWPFMLPRGGDPGRMASVILIG